MGIMPAASPGAPIANPFYLVDINGNPLSQTAFGSHKVELLYTAALQNGQLYTAGLRGATTTVTTSALSIFNAGAATGKNILILSIIVSLLGAQSYVDVRTGITTDPALTGPGVLTPANMKAGGPNSALNSAGITMQASAVAVTPVGTVSRSVGVPSQQAMDVLGVIGAYLLPAGSNQGIEIVGNHGSAGQCTYTVIYVEF